MNMSSTILNIDIFMQGPDLKYLKEDFLMIESMSNS